MPAFVKVEVKTSLVLLVQLIMSAEGWGKKKAFVCSYQITLHCEILLVCGGHPRRESLGLSHVRTHRKLSVSEIIAGLFIVEPLLVL